MTDQHSLDKNKITDTELKNNSTLSIAKNNWQTPNILEINYTSTEGGPGATSDGSFSS
jgi:hypothetical protein